MDLRLYGARGCACLLMLGALLFCSQAAIAQSQAQQQGLAWLNAQVQADGSLANDDTSIATPFQARAESVTALSLLATVPPVLAGKVSAETDGNTEYLARRIIAAAHTQQPTATDVASLLAMQNADGGWGLTAAYASDPLDTAFALQALNASDALSVPAVDNVLYFLAQAKQTDGGWGMADQSSTYVTGNVMLAAAGAQSSNAAGIMASASAWLLSARNASLEFGSTLDNAYGLMALATQSAQSEARPILIGALESVQLADGSWADDPYITALALQALRSASLPSPDQISIRGHVIDGQTGAVFSNVSVSLAGPQAYDQLTDANGDFEFPSVDAGAYTLSLAYSGYGTVTATTTASPGQALDFGTIALLPKPPSGGPTTGTVQGTVTDASTLAAIAGATVTANGTSVNTAADGSYEIPNLAAGVVNISASAAGYQTVTGTGSLATGGIVLFSPQLHEGNAGGDSAASLLGVVTDADTGQPISGASIVVSGANTIAAQTDAAGSYQIDDLIPGTVQIVIGASGYDSAAASTQLQSNTSVTFSPTLYPTGNSPPGANTSGLSGTVVDSTTGLPLPAVTIIATAPDSSTQTVITDATGRFVVSELTQESEALEFSLDGYVSTQFSALIVPLRSVDIGQIRLRPTGVLQLLPDLVVKSVDSKTQALTDPQSFALTGNVQVVIGNHGSAQVPAGIQALAFRDTNHNGGYDLGTDIVLGTATTAAAIEPQTTQAVSIPVSGMLLFRDAPVSVWVDSTQTAIELDETNNAGSSTSQCRLAPPPSKVEAELKWGWSGSAGDPADMGVTGPVMVAHLTDDNGDGKYDENDTPALIAMTQGDNRMLVALSGRDGHELWRRSDLNVGTAGSPAIGDLDGDGRVEIVVTTFKRDKLIALNDDGSLKWEVTTGTHTNDRYGSRDGITIANLDQSGHAEIIFGNRVFDSSGALVWAGTGDKGEANGYPGYAPIAADIDLSSVGMEVLAGRTLYGADGHIVWNRSDISCDGFNAIGDFGYPNPPQVVLVSCGTLYLLNRDGGTIWKTAVAGSGRGGPPTIGDFGGEGTPQIGVAGAGDYAVYGADGSTRWTSSTSDYSSNVTGSSAFDFLENGKVEILYGDERKLRIYDGATGDVLWSVDNPSGTALEYPVVADVDNDGHADIVVGANRSGNFPSLDERGVRVFSAATGAWAPTRTVWNEHAYHVTNINDDGSVPRIEPDSWTHGNTYRLNAFLSHGALDGPDLTAGALQLIDNGTGQPLTLQVRIGNGGQIASKATTAAFYSGDPANGGSLIGSISIDRVEPGKYQDLQLPDVTGLVDGKDIYVDVDPDDIVDECDKTNNLDYIPYAAANSLAQLSVATDQPSYGPNAAAKMSGTANNAGSLAVSYQMDLRIEDSGGNIVDDFGKDALGSIDAGASATGVQSWNTGTSIAGQYVLHGLLYAMDGTLLTEARSPFIITGNSAPATSAVHTDKQTYNADDRAVISSRAQSLSTNVILRDLTLVVKVYDPANTLQFSHSYSINQLLPGALRDFSVPDVLNKADAGTYTVKQDLLDDQNQILSHVETTFMVGSSSDTGFGLSGTIEATPKSVPIGERLTLEATVANTGNSALDNVPLKISIIDPGQNAVLHSFSQTSSLAQGAASVPFDATWTTQGQAGTTYFAVLTAAIGSGTTAKTVTLAQDSFQLTAQLATSITATSGTPQSAIVTETYSQPLQATVSDTVGNPVSGVTVNFEGPTLGATVIFPQGHTAVTDSNGNAILPVAANDAIGAFTVLATAPGVAGNASFALRNTVAVAPFVSVPINPWLMALLAGLLAALGMAQLPGRLKNETSKTNAADVDGTDSQKGRAQ